MSTPNIEILLVAHLAADPAVAAIAGARVGTRTPRQTTTPWVRVILLDDRAEPSSRALHLVHADVQVDCYPGSDRSIEHDDAHDLAKAVRAALHAMPDTVHDGAVVTGVTPGGVRRLPDIDFEPARERYVVTATIHAHTAPA